MALEQWIILQEFWFLFQQGHPEKKNSWQGDIINFCKKRYSEPVEERSGCLINPVIPAFIFSIT
jgi:hypothetical protein